VPLYAIDGKTHVLELARPVIVDVRDFPPDHFGDQIYYHDCDTYAGSSGSSMWEDAGKGDLYIRGVNVAEDDKVNYGVRLIKPYFQFIQDNYK